MTKTKLLISILVIGVLATTGLASAIPGGVPQAIDELGLQFDGINQFLIDLDLRVTNNTNNIANIELLPGPQGIQGEQGIAGIDAECCATLDGSDFNIEIKHRQFQTTPVPEGQIQSFDVNCASNELLIGGSIFGTADGVILNFGIADRVNPADEFFFVTILGGENLQGFSNIDISATCMVLDFNPPP